MDDVFKALADPTRRQLLDALRQQDGQTLAQLCEHSAMSRQAVTKHLNILIAAQLVVAMREGRFKKHYLNPVPIQEIAERWVDQFRVLEVNALLNLKQSLEESS
jgi:DNA-binding transcriptional ArsR family regulator